MAVRRRRATAAAAWPQRLARIGYLSIDIDSAADQIGRDAFLKGLRELGYVEGSNLDIEYRYADKDEERLPVLASELVGLRVDVIVTYATGIFAAARATRTIPIVMAVGPDLVATGLAASLAHPGGNITGSAFFLAELMAKRLELLKEVVPSMTQAGVPLVRDNPANGHTLDLMGAAAKVLRVELQPIELREAKEFASDFLASTERPLGGFVMVDHSQFLHRSAAIAALAAKHRLPSIGPTQLAADGGLMGYGVNFPELFHHAAYFVDRILKREKPGDLPIEQPTKFELVLNLKTAKALGVAIPVVLLATADDVIE